MRFTPLSEEELATQMLIPDGTYRYKVIKAEDKISHAGNEYIALIIKVWDENGRDYNIFTNLALIKLLKHFCDVNGLEAQYKAGELSSALCELKSGGMVMVGTEPEKPNPNGGVYPAKNIIKDYIPPIKGSLLNPLKPKIDDFIDDALPF